MAGNPNVRVAIVGDASSLKRAMGDAESSLDKFSAKTVAIGTAVGQIMAQMATAIVGEISKGITAAKDLAEQFEATQNRIRAAVGTEAGGALYESVKNIYAKTPAGLDEVTAAATRMYQRLSDIGIVGPALEDLTLKLVKLARATGSDVAATADVFSMAVRNWGLSADQTSPALDRILAASQESGVAIGSLLTQITEAGPSMRGLGMSFDEAVTMIAALSENGMDASDVMKAMNKILAESGGAIRTPTEAWKALINELAQAPTFNAAMDLAINKFGLTARSAGQFVQNVREGKLSLDDMAAAIAANGASVSGLAAENATASGKIAILWHNVQLAVEPVLIQLTDLAAGFMDALIQKDAEGKVVGLNLARAWDYVVEEWKKAWPKIEAWLNETWVKFGNWVTGTAIPKLGEWGLDMLGAFTEWMSKIWEGDTTKTVTVTPDVQIGDIPMRTDLEKNAVVKQTQGLKGALAAIPGQITGWLTGGGLAELAASTGQMLGAFVEWAGHAWEGTEGNPGMRQKLEDQFTSLNAWINSDQVSKWMQENGISLVINIAKGIVLAGVFISGAVFSILMQIQSAIRDMALMVFQSGLNLGWQLMKGIAKGIADNPVVDALVTIAGFTPGLGPLASALTAVGNAAEGMAKGGPVRANTPYVIGERGPELFVPNVSGRIVPNGTSAGENVTINVHGSADPRLTAWEIIRARRAQTFLAGAA